MPSSPPNPDREPGRHQPVHWPHGEPGNRSVIIYVTVCTKDRRPILANADAVAAIRRAWEEADAWVIGRYVILPDHLHFFCSPRATDVSLARWIKFWKARASQSWPRREEQPVWQRDFWDTELRQGDSYASKWDYTYRNPVRHALVAQPEEWPWAGEIESLFWYEP